MSKASICFSLRHAKRRYVRRQWYQMNYQWFNHYSTLKFNYLSMPIKTIEVMALPGPELLDPSDRERKTLLDRAKVVEIFMSQSQRVFQGDTIMALEREGIYNNTKRREISYVLSPVTGRIIRFLVNSKDDIRIGDPIYEIDTSDEYDNTANATENEPLPAHNLPPIPPKESKIKKKKKIEYLPIPTDILQHYKLLLNETKYLDDRIKGLRRSKHVATFSPTEIISSTSSKYFTPNKPLNSIAENLIYDQLEIYEQIMKLKTTAYEQTIKTLVSLQQRELSEHEMLQYERINDSDPLDLGSTHKAMGLLYMKLAKYGDDEAYHHMKQAVLLRRKKNRHGNFQYFHLLQDVLVHMGIVQHKRGEVEYARRSLYEAFQQQTRYLGHIYHPVIANTVHLLGAVYHDIGQIEEAARCYETARNMFREIGANVISNEVKIEKIPQIITSDYDFRPATSHDELKFRYKVETAKALNSMSIASEQLGKRHAAIDCCIQELRLRKSVLPENDLSIAKCHYMIGDLLVADGGQQKKDPPINHFLSALSIYEEHNGYYHKTVAMVHISIGALHHKLKKYDDAIDSYKKGTEIFEKTEGFVTLDVASAYLYTGQALSEKGTDYYDEAIEYFLLSYSILKDIEFPAVKPKKNADKSLLDSEHEGRKDAINLLNEDEDDTGIDKKSSEHLVLMSTIQAIATLHEEQENWNEAVDFLEQAIELLISKIGTKQHDVASLYFQLAQTLDKKQDHIQSLELFLKAREVFATVLGDRHPETALCYFKIGLLLRANPNRTSDAINAFTKAHDRWLKEYGPDHDDVLAAKTCIAELEKQKKLPPRSRKLLIETREFPKPILVGHLTVDSPILRP